MRLSQCVLLILLIVVGFAVYSVADEYQGIEKKISQLKRKSEQEREAIRVMRAEWAFLTNPSRMEKIAQQYFKLQPLTEKQIVLASGIPLRSVLDEHLNTQDGGGAQQVQTASASGQPAGMPSAMPPSRVPTKTLPPVQPVSMNGAAQ